MEISKDNIRKEILEVGYSLYPYCSCSHDAARLCEGHRKLVERATALVSKTLQEAERRIEGERVSEDENRKAEDYAYSFNNGVEHALASLRELRESLKG